jgi:DNA-binding MarR family transcriptional regulator
MTKPQVAGLTGALDDATEAVVVVSRVLVGVAAQSLAASEAHITLAQYRALVVLGSAGPQNVGALAEALGVHPSTLTRLCDRLVAKGLIERKVSTQSRRETTVALSTSGRALVRAETDRRRAAVREIVECLDAATQRHVASAFNALADAADHGPFHAWRFGWTA